jgi:hypothetical protein
MKEFKNLWESQVWDFNCIPCYSCDKCKKDFGLVWRAALEWFKKTMDEIEEKDLPIKGQEVIDGELAEE